MKKTFVIINFLIIIFSFNLKANRLGRNHDTIPQKYYVEYDSDSVDSKWPGGRTFLVMTNDRFSKEKLNMIADSLIQVDNGNNMIMAINFFYLPYLNTSLKRSQYATTLSVSGVKTTTTNYLEKDKEMHQADLEASSNRIYFGAWNDNVLFSLIGLCMMDGKFHMEYTYGINARYWQEVDVQIVEGKIFIQVKDNNSVIYIIDNDNLCLYTTHDKECISCYDNTVNGLDLLPDFLPK